MESDRKNGNQMMNDLAQMRRQLDELEASVGRQLPTKDVERLVAELREVNERLVIASVENLDRARAATAEARSARQRMEALLRLVPVAVLVAEAPSGRVILQNEQVDGIWRRTLKPPGGVADYGVFEAFRPNGPPYGPEEWPLARSVRKGEVVMDEEIAFVRGDGSRGIALACSVPLRDKKGRVIAGMMVLSDVTAGRLAGGRLGRLEEVTAALSEAATADEVVRVLLQQGLEATGASAGSAAVLAEDGNSVRLVQDIGHPEELLAPFRHSPIDAPIPIVDVIRTGRPVFLGSVEEWVARYPNLRETQTENQAFVALPMVARRRTVGALGFSFARARDFAEEERRFLESLARQGGLALAAFGG